MDNSTENKPMNPQPFDESLLANILNDIKDMDYLRISHLQVKYSLGFPKASKLVKKLIDLGVLEKEETRNKGHRILKTSIEPDKAIHLTITEKERDLYDFIKNCSTPEIAKSVLADAVNLYRFCNGDDISHVGYLAPEVYRDQVLSKMNKEELLEVKKKFDNEVLSYVAAFTPKECDCGIRISPEGERWFIDEQGTLGYITLYSHYSKMADELLTAMKD